MIVAMLAISGGVVATIGFGRLAWEQRHTSHRGGTVLSGRCYGVDESHRLHTNAHETQCDLAVSYNTPNGTRQTVSFHHVPAKMIVAAIDGTRAHLVAGEHLSAADGLAVSVYFSNDKPNRPINPNAVNPVWVYVVLIALFWGCALGVSYAMYARLKPRPRRDAGRPAPPSASLGDATSPMHLPAGLTDSDP